MRVSAWHLVLMVIVLFCSQQSDGQTRQEMRGAMDEQLMLNQQVAEKGKANFTRSAIKVPFM